MYNSEDGVSGISAMVSRVIDSISRWEDEVIWNPSRRHSQHSTPLAYVAPKNRVQWRWLQLCRRKRQRQRCYISLGLL